MDPACTWWPLPWMSGCLPQAPGEAEPCSWAQSCQKGPVETSPTALTFLVEFLSSTGNSVPSPVTIRDGDGHRAREGWETGQPLAGQGTGTGLLGWWMDSLQPVLFGFFH